MAKVRASVLQLCGTKDGTFGCGCGPAKNAYFAKYPAGTPKALVESPSDHLSGTEGASGARLEGPYITAFLSFVLKGDASAKSAISNGPAPQAGYVVKNQL